MNRSIFTQRMDWHGITVEVSWEPAWLGSEDYRTGHLQVRSVAPERAPLPMTETGYRSAFLHPDIVTEEGGPLTFVRAWLDEAARAPAWQAQQDEARQLVLL